MSNTKINIESSEGNWTVRKRSKKVRVTDNYRYNVYKMKSGHKNKVNTITV